MNLKLINDRLSELLSELNINELPNMPNIGGIIEESEVTFVIVSGEKNKDKRDSVRHSINISLSATLRKEKLNDAGVICCKEDENTLYELIDKVIFSVHKQILSGHGQFLFVAYENFSPDSGKWRSLLKFTVETFIDTKIDSLCEGL
jgi:hypothetical protein